MATRVAAALLIVLAVARAAATWHVFSQTIDEPIHVAAGYQWLAEHKYDIDPEHPPLARVLCAIGPWLAGAKMPPKSSDLFVQGNALFLRHGRYRFNLAISRAGNLPFLVLTLVVVFLWTRRLYGEAAAVAAVALLGAMPPLLAHAALSTTDMAVTAMTVASLYALERWLETPTWPRALLLAFSIALGMLSKFSFPIFFGTGAIVIVVASRRWRVPLAQIAAMAAIAAVTIWAAYFFSVSTLNALRAKVFMAESTQAIAAKYASTPGYEWVRPDLIERYHDYGLFAERHGRRGIDFVDWAKAAGYPSPQAGRHGNTLAGAPPLPKLGVVDAMLEPFRASMQWISVHAPLPAPFFFVGLEYVSRHTTYGHPSYFLGQKRGTGWWYYFPVLLFFKTPIAFLLLCWRAISRPFFIALAMLIPAMASTLNIGIRHILPIYPFLAIVAAAGAIELWRRRRAIAVVLLGWYFVATSLAHPDYLPYFNEFAGRHPERIAVDSNLDWGQDLLRLGGVIREEKIPRLRLAYFGSADPKRLLPVPVDDFPPSTPVAGWVAISENILETDACYAWLKANTPVRRVGKSIELYHVRAARSSLRGVRAGRYFVPEGGRYAQGNFLAGVGHPRRPPDHLHRPDLPDRQSSPGRAVEVGRSARGPGDDRRRPESR